MDISFEEWVTALKVLIALGDKNGFNIHDEEYFKKPEGNYRVAKGFVKSDRLNNNVSIEWEDRI